MKSTHLSVGVLRRGFSLTEVIVTVGIMSCLTALTVPTVKKVNESATSAKCASNLRQLGLAYRLFLIESKGQFPIQELKGPNFLQGWMEEVKPYLHQNGAFSDGGKKDIFYCPGNKESVGDASTLKNLLTSYATNYKCEDYPESMGGGGGYSERYVKNPAEFVLLMDMCTSSRSRWFGDLGGSPNNKDCFVHKGRANCLFLNGRVEGKSKGTFTFQNTCFKGEWPDYWYHHDANNMN